MSIVNDPISDLLTRLRNALAVRHASIVLPTSKIKVAVAKLLLEQGYVSGVSEVNVKENNFPQLKIDLKYSNQTSVIRGLRRISKPGQRIYQTAKNIKPVLGGVGVAVVSTSQGLLTDAEARAKGLGGEVLFKVW